MPSVFDRSWITCDTMKKRSPEATGLLLHSYLHHLFLLAVPYEFACIMYYCIRMYYLLLHTYRYIYYLLHVVKKWRESILIYPWANRFVNSTAVLSCSYLSLSSCWAIFGTRGSPGLGSVNNEQIDKRTLDTVRAGLHCSFRISRQIDPFELILQWYIRVLNVTFCGLNG